MNNFRSDLCHYIPVCDQFCQCQCVWRSECVQKFLINLIPHLLVVIVIMPRTESRPRCSDVPCSQPNATSQVYEFPALPGPKNDRLYPDLADQLKASLSQSVV